MTANGNGPEKISNREIDGSSIVLLITKQEMPSGGVNRPISAPTTVTIPNQPRLTPNGSTAGRNNGPTIRMMDAVSSMVPSNDRDH